MPTQRSQTKTGRTRVSSQARWALAIASLLMSGTIAIAVLSSGGNRGRALPEPGGAGLAVDAAIVRASGVPAADTTSTAAEVTTPVTVDVESYARRHVTGRVTAAGGEALAGALVSWFPLSLGEIRPLQHDTRLHGEVHETDATPEALRPALAARVLTRADGEGAYRLELPSDSPGTILAWHDGFEAALRSAGTGEGGSEPRAASRVDFELSPAGVIEGTVLVEGTLEPAADMVVTAARIDPESGHTAAFGDAGAGAPVEPDGSYRLAGVPFGGYRVLPSSGATDLVAGVATASRRVSLDSRRPSAAVSFTVERGVRISGIVLGPTGRPFAGAECMVVPAELMKSSIAGDPERLALLGSQSARSAADGRFELGPVPTGAEYLVASCAKGHPVATARLEIAVGALQAQARIQLERGWSISGRVLHPDGSPAAGVPVRLLPRREGPPASAIEPLLDGLAAATSDAGGLFVINDLPSGLHELIAGNALPPAMPDRRGASEVLLDGLADAAGIELVAGAAGEEASFLAGWVVDARGRPLDGAALSVIEHRECDGLPPAGRAAQALSGPGGAFHVHGIREGLHTVAAGKEGYRSTTLRDVESGTGGVILRLVESARVHGVIRAGNGVSIGAGAAVTVESAAGGEAGRGEVGADGSFNVEAPPGACRVRVRAAGYAPAVSAMMDLEPGEVREGVELFLSTGAAITGKVTGPGHVPVAGATVTVVAGGEAGVEDSPAAAPAAFDSVTTDDAGRFEMPHLAPGRYTLRAAHVAHAASAAITVALIGEAAVEAPPLLLPAGGELAEAATAGDTP